MDTLVDRAGKTLVRAADYLAGPEILGPDQLIELIIGTPEDQARHSVVTIIALIRCLPETDRVRAYDSVCADIWEGVVRDA